MPMSPRDVVRAAVQFQTPDRLPVRMNAIGYDDVVGVSLRLDSERSKKGIGADEWGCVWGKTDVKNMGQVIGHPIKSLDQIDSHPFPDPHDPAVIASVETMLEKNKTANRYVAVDQFMILFERMHSLIGFKECLEGLATEPDAMARLADRIVAYDIERLRFVGDVFGSKIDSYSGTDDWGTQIDSFISPKMWREFFLPRYKRICDACKDYGWNVHLHSCGKVNRLLPLMREAGIKSVNLQQPRALGIETVGQAMRGKICFDSLADIQTTLPSGRLDEIEKDADMLLTHWAAPTGGFILSDYGDGEAIGASNDAKKTMLRAFLDRDPYAKKSGVQHPAYKVL
ncbi:MAG: uroporphyrinogen decarboxylase family protein [Planctomycetota bacterium]